MTRPIILLDVDGVLADFTTPVLREKSFGPPKGWEPFTSNPTKCVERDLTKGGSDHGTD